MIPVYSPIWGDIAETLDRLVQATGGTPSPSIVAVAAKPPNWRSIRDGISACITVAGGTPMTYPANPRGVILALQDLAAAIAAGGTIATHVAQANPHPQYALDTDLTGYATTSSLTSHTSNPSNPHATTAAQVGAIATTAAGAASGVATLDGSTKIPIGQIPTGSSSSTVAIGNDARLSDTRSPTALSVVDGSVSASAAIAWSKISKSGAVASDISAAPATHSAASANVHGLPASVNVLGDRNAAGEFIQHGSATANSVIGSVTINTFRFVVVTFPVAFASTPRVLVSGSNVGNPFGTSSLSTTGFTLLAWGDASMPATHTGNYLAIGT